MNDASIPFSQLLTEVDQNHVRDVVIQGPEIHDTFTNGLSFQTCAPNDPTLVSLRRNGKASITAKPPGDNVPWSGTSASRIVLPTQGVSSSRVS